MSASLWPDLAMAPTSDGQGIGSVVLRDALSFVLGTTCLVMMGTCLSMWSAQRLIEQSIANILKSDTDQTAKIERLQAELNALRIEQGIQRGRLMDMSRRFVVP
jgi:hypothetical protein